MENRSTNTNATNGVVYGPVFQAGQVVGDIHYHTDASSADHQVNGLAALDNKDYATAIQDLKLAQRAHPANVELHYFMAIALLQGRRPHRVRLQTELEEIRRHLRQADHLPHAKLLSLLVEEDRGRHWERNTPVSGHLRELVGEAERARILEIAEHIAAPRNRVWKIIVDEAESGEAHD